MVFDLLQVGEKAPSFSLMNYDGKEVSLSDFKDKNEFFKAVVNNEVTFPDKP